MQNKPTQKSPDGVMQSGLLIQSKMAFKPT
jgi:hypothetical protein